MTSFPRGSPDFNPVEECWRQLTRTLGTRFFESIDDLRPAMTAALAQSNQPQIPEYFRRSVSVATAVKPQWVRDCAGRYLAETAQVDPAALGGEVGDESPGGGPTQRRL